MNDAVARIHHDGSGTYVADAHPALGDDVALLLRVPRALAVESVWLRTVIDGEPRVVPAAVSSQDGVDDLWEAVLPVRNPVQHYRWRIEGGGVGYAWCTAAGLVDHDVTDAHDFALSTGPAVPAWLRSAVVYQVFPDRFARSGRITMAPAWAVPRDWTDRPEGRGPTTGREWFGGDLWGVIDHLDHIADVGADTVYLTPFFPSQSNHRYDAASFDHVDPALGGDEALIALTAAAHARGMRVIGDLTTNHTGVTHPWFVAAQAGDPEWRNCYRFDPTLPHGYVSWFGVRTLPKLDYASAALRGRMLTDEDSVLRRWLRAPFHLDGWRIDVANMTGRLGAEDRNHEIARLAREAVIAEGPDKALIAEHFHDAGPDLPGDGWQGAMNYAAFQRPVTAWLRDPEYAPPAAVPHAAVPRLGGVQAVASLRSFASRMPWEQWRASWNLLGSHDTPRIRTITGDRERQLAAVLLMVTLPGTPMLFAGDEIGAEGRWGEEGRTPFPWQAPERWDTATLAAYRELLHLRRSAPALADGGLRWVLVTDDVLAFLRERAGERLLILVARTATAAVAIDAEAFGIHAIAPVHGFTARLDAGRLNVDVPGAGGGIWRIS